MPFAHVLAGIVVRTAGHHRQECLLLGGLARHINTLEETVDIGVGQYPAIENIDGGIDGGFATELFIDCTHIDPSFVLLHTCPHKLHVECNFKQPRQNMSTGYIFYKCN